MKKKATKKPKSKKGGKCFRVDLVEPAPTPDPVTLSEKKKEGVYWVNGTDRGRTVTFEEWPFVEPPQAILVPAGKKSACFHIYDGAYKLYPFTYKVDPTLVPSGSSGGGPGDPSIIGDD